MRKTTCLIILAGFLAAGFGRAQTVDCIVAVVNGQALTLTDVQVALEFRLFAEDVPARSGDGRLAVLDALIDQKAVLGVAREPMTVDTTELDAALASVQKSMGPEAFRAALRKFGLKEADLRPYLEERIRFARATTTRFRTSTALSMADVEKYYTRV
jgi:hypothetical protein